MWMPIDTAPMDVECILGWDAGDGEMMVMARANNPNRWCVKVGDEWYSSFPTHWMPLPEPPK